MAMNHPVVPLGPAKPGSRTQRALQVLTVRVQTWAVLARARARHGTVRGCSRLQRGWVKWRRALLTGAFMLGGLGSASVFASESLQRVLQLFGTSVAVVLLCLMHAARQRDARAAQVERQQLNRALVALQAHMRSHLLDQLSALSEQVEKLDSRTLHRLGSRCATVARRARDELEGRSALEHTRGR